MQLKYFAYSNVSHVVAGRLVMLQGQEQHLHVLVLMPSVQLSCLRCRSLAHSFQTESLSEASLIM